jgi:hypothetical protein
MLLWSDDVIDGKLLFINRFDQNAMGMFNSPSHFGWAPHPNNVRWGI